MALWPLCTGYWAVYGPMTLTLVYWAVYGPMALTLLYWAGYGPTAVPATGPGTALLLYRLLGRVRPYIPYWAGMALYPLLGRYGPILGLYGPILVYRACMALYWSTGPVWPI